MCLLGLCAAQGSMGVAAPQMGSLLALAKSKHFASCQFSIACKRTGAKQCVQQNNNKDGEMGKMEKTFPRRTRIRFGTRIRIRIRFHFNFTWRLLSFWIYI